MKLAVPKAGVQTSSKLPVKYQAAETGTSMLLQAARGTWAHYRSLVDCPVQRISCSSCRAWSEALPRYHRGRLLHLRTTMQVTVHSMSMQRWASSLAHIVVVGQLKERCPHDAALARRGHIVPARKSLQNQRGCLPWTVLARNAGATTLQQQC